jgi:hypothetical protein
VILALLSVAPAEAFDAEKTFVKGAVVVSLDAGAGRQNNLEDKRAQTDLELWWVQGRVSLLPFGTVGKDGVLYGALETGLEPIFQKYERGADAHFAGLGFAARYHFLPFGAFVPYLEMGAAAGSTNLRSIEVDSSFTFRVYGGVGASVFVADHAALYAGYRMIHVSNGNASSPNRGFEANTGVAGFSFFFP